MVTHTYSGGRDQTAVIGHAPEDRNWKPGDRAHKPFIGSGARIEAYVTVDAGTKRATHIGRRTWLMKHVHVGHDAHIGQDCEIAPGAVICGWAEIGNGVKIGVNASILPHRKVGDGARIGAGAVVTKDVPAGETWIGNPARPMGATVTRDLPHPDAVPRLPQSIFNSEKQLPPPSDVPQVTITKGLWGWRKRRGQQRIT